MHYKAIRLTKSGLDEDRAEDLQSKLTWEIVSFYADVFLYDLISEDVAVVAQIEIY